MTKRKGRATFPDAFCNHGITLLMVQESKCHRSAVKRLPRVNCANNRKSVR